MQDLEVHFEYWRIRRVFLNCDDRACEQSVEIAGSKLRVLGQIFVHWRFVDGCENKHVSELSMHGAKDIRQNKPFSTCTAVPVVGTVLWCTDAVEGDRTLDGSLDTDTSKVNHFSLVVRQVNHLHASVHVRGH
jgi:hypothetical protein